MVNLNFFINIICLYCRIQTKYLLKTLLVLGLNSIYTRLSDNTVIEFISCFNDGMNEEEDEDIA